MDEDERVTSLILTLAARKADYARNVIAEIESKHGDALTTYERHRLKDAVFSVASELDPSLFTGPGERERAHARPTLALEDLEIDRQQVWEETKRLLIERYPELGRYLG